MIFVRRLLAAIGFQGIIGNVGAGGKPCACQTRQHVHEAPGGDRRRCDAGTAGASGPGASHDSAHAIGMSRTNHFAD